MDLIEKIRQTEREKIIKTLYKEMGKLVHCNEVDLIRGPYSDEPMRGPNVERVKLVNKYDIGKVFKKYAKQYNIGWIIIQPTP